MSEVDGNSFYTQSPSSKLDELEINQKIHPKEIPNVNNKIVMNDMVKRVHGSNSLTTEEIEHKNEIDDIFKKEQAQKNDINTVIISSRPKKMKKIKAKKRTLQEFKNWLEGLQEFQSEDWIPNADQWNLIKESIYVIKDTPVVKAISTVTQPVINNVPNSIPVGTPGQSSLVPRPVEPTGLTTPPRQNIDMRNLQAGKTDLDTSASDYVSEFN